MKIRRRQRWLRRIALGLAFATAAFAGPAQAKHDVDGAEASRYQGSRYITIGGWSGYVDMETGVPASAGLAEAQDPFLTDVAVRQGESLGGPDGLQQSNQESSAEFIPGVTDFPRTHVPISALTAATRPDDRADRFAHTDAVVASSATDSGFAVEWDDGLQIGIAALVLALAIGLGVGYLRRPRLAL